MSNNIVNTIMDILLAGNPEEALKGLMQDGGGTVIKYLMDYNWFKSSISDYLQKIENGEIRGQLEEIINEVEKQLFEKIRMRDIDVIVRLEENLECRFSEIDIMPELHNNLIKSFICYIMTYIHKEDPNYFNALNMHFEIIEQGNENIQQNQRIQQLETMNDKLQVLLKRIEPDEFHASPIINGCDSLNINDSTRIADRTSELAQINEIFQNGSHVAFLYGRPGIGKTTLARLYANYCTASQIYFVKYDQSIEHTVSKLSIDPQKYTGQDILKHWSVLSDAERKSILLIIDNFNEDSLQGSKKRNFMDELNGDFYKKLLDTGIRIIFTTRIQTNRSVFEVPPVKETFELFKQYCESNTITPDEEILIKKIIDAVHSNTLLIVLAAHIWRRSSIDEREKLLEAILGGTLQDNGLLIPTNAELETNESEKTIYNQAAALLDFSGILEKNEPRKVFANAALLPLQGFLKFDFLNLTNCADDNVLNDLINGCWVLCENNMVMMHPVIREIAFSKGMVSYSLCHEYCENINANIDIEKPLINRIMYKKCAYEIFDKFKNIEEMDIVLVRLFYRLSDIYDSISEKKISMEIADVVFRNIVKMEDHPLERARMLSGIAYSINNCFDSMDDLEKANNLLSKAEEIINNLEIEKIDRLQYALAYGKILSNFGSNCISKSKCNLNEKDAFLTNALKWHQNALEFRQNQLDRLYIDDDARKIMKSEVATSYTNVATTYFLLRRYEDAITYHMKAYELRRELGNENAQSVNIQRIIGCVLEIYKSHLDVSQDYISDVMSYYPDLLKTNYKFNNLNSFKKNWDYFFEMVTIVKYDRRFSSLRDEMSKKVQQLVDWINSKADLKDVYKEKVEKICETVFEETMVETL